MVALFCCGNFSKQSFNNSVLFMRFPLLWLNDSKRVGYIWSVKSASGNSLKNNFSTPVTECISTSFSSCSASYESEKMNVDLK